MIATPEKAVQIKDEIKSFLTDTLKLELSMEKSKITDLLHDKASFLGFYIMINKPKESEYSVRISYGRSRRTRISHNRLCILIPITKIMDKLAEKGFLRDYKSGGKLVPNAITK